MVGRRVSSLSLRLRTNKRPVRLSNCQSGIAAGPTVSKYRDSQSRSLAIATGKWVAGGQANKLCRQSTTLTVPPDVGLVLVGDDWWLAEKSFAPVVPGSSGAFRLP